MPSLHTLGNLKGDSHPYPGPQKAIAPVKGKVHLSRERNETSCLQHDSLRRRKSCPHVCGLGSKFTPPIWEQKPSSEVLF